MRDFKFNGESYIDLNSLGLAFKNNFEVGMKAITEKAFLKFLKQFKSSYKNVNNIILNTKYLQNALSLIIYELSSKFVIFGKEYDTLQSILKDIDSEDMLLFARESGFSKTICKKITDERLKKDLITFEKNNNNIIAIRYMKEYNKYVTIENTNEINRLLVSSEELFKRAIDLFCNKDFLVLAAHLHSLEEVLDLSSEVCAVFKGVKLLQKEISIPNCKKILNNGFYLWILDHLSDYKYIGAESKLLKKQINKIKKKINNPKTEFNELCDLHGKLYLLYIRFASLFNDGKIRTKNERYALNISYCKTYIPEDYIALNLVNLPRRDDEKIDIVKEKSLYNLEKYTNSIEQHANFGKWGLTFSILMGLYIGVCYGLRYFNIDMPLFVFRYETKLLPTFIYAGSLCLLFCMSIVFLCKAKSDDKKCIKLGKLNYYRKNVKSLTEEDMTEFNKLVENEEVISKSIDKRYPLYGCFAVMGFSLALTLVIYSLLYLYGNSLLGKDLAAMFVKPYLYLIFVPTLICSIFALIRHKKNGLSLFLVLIFTLIMIIGIIVVLFP